MSRTIVTFMAGAFVSSAWWSLAVMPKGHGKWEGGEWLIPGFTTLFFLAWVAFWLHDHWDDE